MTVGVDSNESGEDDIDSRAGSRKGRTTVVVTTKETITIAVRETTLNSLITGVTFGESAIGLRGFSANYVSDAILNGWDSWQQHAHNLDICST